MYSLSPFNLTQVVHAGTHQNCSGVSLLDLIFVSVASFLYNIGFVTSWKFRPLRPSTSGANEKVKKERWKTCFLWKYSQGDYDRARFLIDSTSWNLLLTNDINTSLHNWQNQFLLIIEECIPRVSPSSRRRHP